MFQVRNNKKRRQKQLVLHLIYCFIDLTKITAQTSHRQHLGMESVKVLMVSLKETPIYSAHGFAYVYMTHKRNLYNDIQAKPILMYLKEKPSYNTHTIFSFLVKHALIYTIQYRTRSKTKSTDVVHQQFETTLIARTNVNTKKYLKKSKKHTKFF